MELDYYSKMRKCPNLRKDGGLKNPNAISWGYKAGKTAGRDSGRAIEEWSGEAERHLRGIYL